MIITHVKSKESKKQLLRMFFSIKLADRKMTIKKENISSSLIYDTVNLSKMAGKAEPFSRKISYI